MTISFITPGTIDLKAAFTFGVSAKETENAIGFFGTGLKYAVATLLRTGHEIWMDTLEGDTIVRHEFTEQPYESRGQTFQLVCLDGESLGFTTALGRNWEVWMAYRELHSNTLDEKGFTISGAYDYGREYPNCSRIVVKGDGIETSYRDRDAIFCSSDIIGATGDIEFRQGTSPVMFYRGVRAIKTEYPCMMTINVLASQKLTEDRTFAEAFWVDHLMPSYVSKLKDQKLCQRILTCKDNFYEGKLDFSGVSGASPEFTAAIKKLRRDRNLNHTAMKWALKNGVFVEDEIQLNEVQSKQLERALEFLRKLDFRIDQYNIKFANLNGALGQAKEGTIYVSPEAFRMGTKYVAGTIFEEFIHMSEGVSDCSRSMQNVLIDTIMSMGEKLTGEPV